MKEKGTVGRPPVDPRHVALCPIIRAVFGFSYRSVYSLLAGCRDYREVCRIKRVPGYNTVQGHVRDVGEGYIDGLVRLTSSRIMIKRRDWRRYERNWRAYERFRRDEVELFLKTAREVVWSLEAPWGVKHTGRPSYPPRSMVLLCLLKTELKMDYRGISSYLKANPEQLKLVGLDKAPSHTAIRNALSRIPEPYLRSLNDRLAQPFKKGALEPIAQASPPSVTRHGSA